MTPTLREQLLAPRTSPAGSLTLARGVGVFVRRLTLAERLEVEALLDKSNPRAIAERVIEVCAVALVDETNAGLFERGDGAIREALDSDDATALLQALLEFNRMTAGSRDAGKPSGGGTPTSASSPPCVGTSG